MRYINLRWVEETDANILYDALKFAKMSADNGVPEFSELALRMIGHALEPVLNRMMRAELEKEI